MTKSLSDPKVSVSLSSRASEPGLYAPECVNDPDMVTFPETVSAPSIVTVSSNLVAPIISTSVLVESHRIVPSTSEPATAESPSSK